MKIWRCNNDERLGATEELDVRGIIGALFSRAHNFNFVHLPSADLFHLQHGKNLNAVPISKFERNCKTKSKRNHKKNNNTSFPSSTRHRVSNWLRPLSFQAFSPSSISTLLDLRKLSMSFTTRAASFLDPNTVSVRI